jgi:Pregnancy-associated plasma protein-A/GEVED domain
LPFPDCRYCRYETVGFFTILLREIKSVYQNKPIAMRSKVLSCCILTFSFFYLHAQPRCGFDVKMRSLRKQNSRFEKETNEQVRQFILNQRLGRQLNSLATVYYVPVVVHVIHTGGAVGTIYNPSDATITSAINYLNSVYDGTWNGAGGSILGVGDIQIKFVLASRDPNGNSTTGIDRTDGTVLPNYSSTGIPTNSVTDEIAIKNLSRWDPERYYNVWVVNKIDGLDGTSGSFIAGYAYFPNAYSADELRLDGTVMLATQMAPGAKTLPHEIGHAFGLFHVFEGENDVPGMNACPSISSSGDDCADTDPVINPADDGYGAGAFSCRSGINPCTSTAYNDNTEKNFMNYTNCYQLFTSDQKTRMLATSATSNRNSLVTSWANNQGTYPITWSAPAAAAVIPLTGSTYPPDFLGVLNVNLNGINIYSLNATEDGGYLDNAKWYNLIQLMPNTTYTMDVGLLNSGNFEQLGVWIDYDGNGSFNNTNERIYYATDNAPADGVSFSFTTPASLSGNIVRMRVMNDFSTRYGISAIDGSTSFLEAGQAEDYPLLLTSTTTLPLKLIEFTGSTRQHTNYLQWKTTNENNTKQFEVQRSFSGSDFTSIGTVAAEGTTTTQTTYHFNDNNQAAGIYVYRIKMIDVNGSFTYSNSVNLKIEDPTSVEVVGNPFTNSIKLRIPQNTSVALRLMDASGRTLIQRNIHSQTGLLELPVDPSWSKGVYLLETTINNVKTVHKLIKN